ncbi:ferredoxin, 2Fe-2S [Lentzea fradiae]|uniref:Ferredoxin, 2Fe-2S n=1 Tax=Lentzea fradiae TaxID=200378 RepID=A0A1G7R3C9_9PSEU|nr:2Fe-2S iron-sulfur cluster-binding protein [Lentzea fradiae]SDG05237.1 ferredoxin, 2Fe-2S [Lentzea fradiae]
MFRLRSADGNVIELEPEHGESVMDTAVRAGVDGIVGECGGSASCGTCHVFVPEEHLARLDPPEFAEEQTLGYTAVPRTDASRLACQVPAADVDGAVLDLPERQY